MIWVRVWGIRDTAEGWAEGCSVGPAGLGIQAVDLWPLDIPWPVCRQQQHRWGGWVSQDAVSVWWGSSFSSGFLSLQMP